PPPPPAPAPAPAGPPVALATEISDAAAVYVDYVQKASAIKNQFADGADIQAKLAAAEAYEPNQLANGAVAFAAIVAMQEPAFRASLRNYATDNAVRADMVNRLLSDPAYVAVLPGADAAARRVILAMSSDGQLVYKAGAAVKQSAYDIQTQKWSREFVSDREGRLAKAKSSAVTLASVQSDASAQLLTAALTGSGLTTRATTGQSTGSYAVGGDGVTFTPGTGQPAQPQATVSTPIATEAATTSAAAKQPQTVFDRPDLFNQPYTQAVNRALTIAAIAILGEGGATRAPALTSLMNDGEGQKCLAMSKLNLYQCLAVAKPHYEDIFCLGQHVLMDTGQCLGQMSSNALSFEPVKRIGFKADGTSAYADPKPYLKPAPVKKASGKKASGKKKTGTAKKT
ncbi:hypothetical protein AEAC466_14220, partial [Asticcacaulis sp. AC466]|uniref:hypothetical protein n=1 Tax=Asticcacaulis sp. AC466 TaxID=1282362 RepID=UPI0003C3D028